MHPIARPSLCLLNATHHSPVCCHAVGAQIYHEVHKDPNLQAPAPDTIERNPLKSGMGGYGTADAPVVGVPVTVNN